jgi:LuxR family maltose regulon positive regulatory protein
VRDRRDRSGLLGPPSPRSFDGLVTALINELAARPNPDGVLLVLDDYHLIDSAPVHESVAFLLENLPPGLRLVVSSRADPPLPLARLRARGQLAELRAAELRFTPEEAAVLLGEEAGPGLPGSAVATLTARTEGWAAGLQLAGLSLRGHADPAGFVAAFSGSHRFVLDYLADEVLAGQTGPVREFLLETSVLERLSGELCDAVTGRAGSQALLQDIERAGLFLVPLDEVRGWWRYHHLFADLLRARLQAEQPGRVKALHRAAATWCEEHDLADDAVRHALAAGDAAWAARLVEWYVASLLRRGEGATLRRWLSVLPAQLLAARPRLSLAQAFIAIVGGQVEVVEPLLDDAESAYAAASDQPEEPPTGPVRGVLANIPGTITFMRAELARLRGDAARAADWDRQALAQLGDNDFYLRSLVRANLAVADWLRGHLEQAEHGLAEVLAERRAVRATSPRGPAMTWAKYSAPRATWMRRSPPTGKRWMLPVKAVAKRPIWVWHTWAWPRCCTSGTSWPPPLTMPPWGSRSAGSSPSPRRSSPAWWSWPGSGRRTAIRPPPWRPWARPGRSS